MALRFSIWPSWTAPCDIGRDGALGLHLDSGHVEEGGDGVEIQVIDLHRDVARSSFEAPALLLVRRDLSGGLDAAGRLGLGDDRADIELRRAAGRPHVQGRVEVGELHGLCRLVSVTWMLPSRTTTSWSLARSFMSNEVGSLFGGGRAMSQIDGHSRLIDHGAIQAQIAAEKTGVARLAS